MYINYRELGNLWDGTMAHIVCGENDTADLNLLVNR